MAKKVLIITTSHDQLGDTGKTTGSWMEELAAPYFTFKEAGVEVVIASVKGGEVPMDEASLEKPFLTPEAEKFLLTDDAVKALENTPKFTDLNVPDFDAIFLPGGHGVCFDLPENKDLAAVLSQAFQAGKVVSAVCHGPVGLVGATDAEGNPIVKGKKVTGFSNDEEIAVGKDNCVPFLLEDKLKELGGLYEKAPNWTPFAVRDGNLVTGQNPASSQKVAELVLKALA